MQATSEVTRLGQGITCLRAANPSPMTGSGTNSYLIQTPASAVLIDPGPDLDLHLEAILDALAGRILEAILITHAHLDHTSLTARLAARTGAATLAFGRADEGRSPQMQRLALSGMNQGGEGIDNDFAPDRRISHGEKLKFGATEIEVIATPGHLSGHLCFGYQDLVFTGDHVMGWSTSLISPPDGDMGAYMASLAALQLRDWTRFLPGHGPEINDPGARLSYLIAHRKSREASILASLQAGPATPQSLAKAIYTDTPGSLMPAAARNILAHLIDLQNRNRVQAQSPLRISTPFELI